jgi:hypothetical protein
MLPEQSANAGLGWRRSFQDGTDANLAGTAVCEYESSIICSCGISAAIYLQHP